MDIANVLGHLFKPTGKWKYEVYLDYTGILDENGKPADGSTYIAPNDAALRALRQATSRGTSGVSLLRPGDYFLVVFDAPQGFPVLVPGDWISELRDVFA